MKKFFIKFLLLCFSIMLISLFFYNCSFAKYIIENTHIVANINIDKDKPKMEFISSKNTNKNYEKYANHTHTLTLRFKAIEDNLKVNNINKDNIKFKVNNDFVNPKVLNLTLISENSKELVYDISITNVEGNGILHIVFPTGLVIDNADQTNDETIFDTGIIIDNIAPTYILTETLLANKQSNVLISANESIRPFDGWKFSNDNKELSLNFPSPIDYEFPIIDYAENYTNANVVVEKASYITINYLNYTYTAFSEFTNGGKVSNKDIILNNDIHKTESVFVYTEGNANKDFLDCRFYDYTYWGEGTEGLCTYAECSYKYGYNPGNNAWYNMSSSCDGHFVNFNGTRCLELGGIGQNLAGHTSLGSSSNPIPEDIASQFLFGVSGINFKLNTTEDYSVVYQIYVRDVGWINSCADGKECSYRHDKPFSGFRMNLIPKSEKQRYMSYWDKDVGTSNVK